MAEHVKASSDEIQIRLLFKTSYIYVFKLILLIIADFNRTLVTHSYYNVC